MKIVKLESFHLVKAKLKKNGGLVATFKETRELDGELHEIETTKTSKYLQHPDLSQALESFKIDILRCDATGPSLEQVVKLSGLKGKGLDALNAAVENVKSRLLDKIEITGVHISGKEANRGVIISAKKESFKDKPAFNTPRIVFSHTTYGFEEVVEEKVADVEREVYEYIFGPDGNGLPKRAQLDLFEENDTESGDAVKGKEKPKLEKVA